MINEKMFIEVSECILVYRRNYREIKLNESSGKG